MFTVAPTDSSWFNQLKSQNTSSNINFWTPTPWNLKGLSPGSTFYFLLKAPIRKVGGKGVFREYKTLTVENAWREFGFGNGCQSFEEFTARIQKYINKNSQKFGGRDIDVYKYTIGAICLDNCEFWQEDEFIDLDEYNITFPPQVVKNKYYYIEEPFKFSAVQMDRFELITTSRELLSRQVNQRKGQSRFKAKILSAYQGRCCLTGETCPELLEAAHIQAYINETSHHVQNGILFRVDIHRLFDNHLLTVDADYRIRVSTLLQNSPYFKFNGASIQMPVSVNSAPSKVALAKRNELFRH